MLDGKKVGVGRGRRFWLKFYAQLIGLLLLIGFLGLRMLDPLPVQLVRYQIFDQFQTLWPRTETTGQVVIVDLDEASLARHGQWPWPRTLLARLVDRLFAEGADVVAFDIVFAEPDRLSPPNFAQTLEGLSPSLLGSLERLPDSDATFGESIARHKVVLGQPALHNLPYGADTEPTQAGTAVELGGDPRPFLQRYEGLVRNLPILEASAGGIGTVTIALDQDGMVRRVPLAIVVGGRILPALGIEALRLRADEPSLVIRRGPNGIAGVSVGGHQVPTDSQGRIWIRYGEAGSIPYITAADAMVGLIDPGAVDGRIVLIGSTAAGLLDIKRTPLSPATPGVEVHAHLLETVLTGSHLHRPTAILGAEIIAIAVTGLLVIFFVPSLGALATLFIGGGLMAALGGLSWYLFAKHQILFDASFPALSSFSIYAVFTFLKYMQEESERKTVRTAFAQYLPPAVVERLALHPDQLRLGGESREMTILFADLRGFTTMSEHLEPDDLGRIVNRVLGTMTDAVLAHGGTVDKYIGDCVMALWNAPLDDPEHARRACLSALAMVEAVRVLDQEIRSADVAAAGSSGISVGVGLNTGSAAVGNFGSSYRFDYTALGDTVNLAARLEPLTKMFGCPVIIGETTAAAAADLAMLELDVLQVKGRFEPVRIFALLGDNQLATTPDFTRLRMAHAALIEACSAGQPLLARQHLDNARQLAADLPLERAYERIAQRIESITSPAAAPADSHIV
jgi:adenylate cyclase